MKLLPIIVYIASMLALSACAGALPDRPSPSPARSSELPRSGTSIAGSEEARQCLAALQTAQVRFTPLPDRQFGGGCSAFNSVKLLDIGTPVTNIGAMTCPLAKNFAAWARYGVQPAARQIMGSEVVRIESYGTYSCRAIAGSTKISEHAHSNAIDIASFVLANGDRISVKDGWRGDEQQSRFLRVVHQSACKRFKTALGPDYNRAHEDHLHFDMGGAGGFCR